MPCVIHDWALPARIPKTLKSNVKVGKPHHELSRVFRVHRVSLKC